MHKIESKVKEIIAHVLVLSDHLITDEANLMEDLGADSLDVIEVFMDIESAFSITIPDEDSEKLLTVKAIVDYVKDRKDTIIY